jgi:cysteine desulfurase
MIYLDNAATTPIDPNVLKAMLPFFSKQFANPASIHSLGQTSLKAVDDARYSIAKILNTSGNEIIFTSGATWLGTKKISPMFI